MKLFNYLFYKLHWWHTEKISSIKEDWLFSCISGLTFFQTTNLLSLYIYIMLLLKKHSERIDYVAWGIAIFLFVINSIYYKKNEKYKFILKKYKEETESFKRKYNGLCICYIFLTLILIAITLYIGRLNNYSN